MTYKAGLMVTMTSNGLAVPAPQNYMENGRLYHGFRKGIYMYPCDEAEKDRMDIYHQIFLIARRGSLHQAPVRPNWEEPRILDLGCGTGIWAIDMADQYINAEVSQDVTEHIISTIFNLYTCTHIEREQVRGLDLVNIQPEKIPPKLRFHVRNDYESPWSLGEDAWDLIHLRMGCGSVSSWPDLYQKIFTHLKPGYGSIEQVEIDLQPRCDDGTLAPDSPVVQWYQYLADATERVARPIAYQHNTRQMLQAAGFIDIQETVIRAPYNPWPADPHQKEIGRWYNLGITEGLEAMSMAPFTRVNRWDANEHVRPLCEAVRRQICSKKMHGYNNIHVWTARRPQQ